MPSAVGESVDGVALEKASFSMKYNWIYWGNFFVCFLVLGVGR